jgi:hypothetical protein
MKKNLYAIFLSLAFSVILWVSVSLSNDYNTNLQLPIKFFNVPEGYVATSPSSEKINVKVRGKGWNLISAMIATKSEYYVDMGNELRKKKIIDLRSFDTENTWLTSKLQIVEITPDTISFSFEKISYAKLKIAPNLKIEFKQGYGLASDIVVIPESITISGPITRLSTMQNIPTESIIIKDLSERTEKIVKIENIPGLNYETQTARVILNVQRIIEQSFDEINVKVLDIPIDRDVVLLPNKINILLKGGIDVLGKLNNNKITAFIYYRDVVLDTIGSITPVVNIPEHTELVYIKPQQLNYVIKKFKK